MYRIGKRQHGLRRRRLVIGCVLMGVALATVYLLTRELRSTTELGPTPKAVITQVSGSLATKNFDEGLFSLSLPYDWEFINPPKGIYNQYNFRNTVPPKGARQLTIYADTIPANFAANRFLAIEAVGSKLRQDSEVSDNCVNFTATNQQTSTTGIAQSKWNNLEFLCDVGNYSRDVVVTGSKDGLNTVIVSSSASGPHKFLFVYTDNSPQADYSIFASSLASFQLK